MVSSYFVKESRCGREFTTTHARGAGFYKIDLGDLWLEVWQPDAEAEPALKSLLDPLDEETVEKLDQVPKSAVKPQFGKL